VEQILESTPLHEKEHALVVFSHGKESGPNGAKIQAMREAAENLGFKTVSIDYRACQDEVERKSLLRSYLSNQSGKIILVGSSMGGYVSAALANEFELSALFLLCPALSLEGYERVDYTPRTDKIVLVHGWNDDVVPVESSIQFAREHKAMLHLLPDNHRLSGSISHLVIWLESLLKSLIESEN
jgi:alpha/beta superfamily hydrolase